MADKNIWIWFIGIVIVIALGMFIQKSYEIFATLPVGQYIQFRTTDLGYVSGSAIAFTSTCGGTLIPYGFIAEGWGVGSCAPYVSETVFILDNLPGGIVGYESGPKPSLYSSEGYAYICDDSGSSNKIIIYSLTSPYASKVDVRNVESIDSTKEVTCGCPGGHQCGDSVIGSAYCDGNTVKHNIIDYVCPTEDICREEITVIPELNCASIPTTPFCQNGVCVASCVTRNTPADTNCDNIVSFAELIAYANKWTAGTVTFTDLMQAANAWASS